MNSEVLPEPVLQILGIRNLKSEQERYRLILSDGQYFSTYAVLGSQLNELKHKGLLNENAIVRLDKYTTAPATNNFR